MMDKIKAHFFKLAPRRFVMGTVAVLLILDIINSYYLKLYWLKKDLSTLMVHMSIRNSNLVLEEFSQDTILGMKGFIDNAFYFFIFLVLINNVFFYFFYLRKKLWAQGYVLFYTLTAAIFSVSFVLDNAGLGWSWLLYNISTIFIYAYLYFGVKVLKYETTDAIPEDEKKGR